MDESRKKEIEYLTSLQVGERVIETTKRCAYEGVEGVVYQGQRGLCVKWADGMGTSVTHGTRRLHEQHIQFDTR